MTRREAGLILGCSPGASKEKMLQAHKRIMIANHPDRGALQPLRFSSKWLDLAACLPCDATLGGILRATC